MSTTPPSDSARQVGAVENGHVLTAAGWVPLRWLPVTAQPPYYPGDARNGYVFTGSDWALIPVAAPLPRPAAGAPPPPKKKAWLPWGIGGAALVLVLSIGASALGELQSTNDKSETKATDTATTDAADTAADESTTPKPKPKKPPKATPADPNRVVVDDMWIHNDLNCSSDRYSSTVTGTITNESGSAKRYVQVSFGLYDSSGALLGTALANVSNLASGTDWKYKAVGFVPNFERCKLEDVTAY